MKSPKHLIWLFPVLTLSLISLLHEIGASRISRATLKKQLARQYGVSEATVELYADRLPEGWQLGDRIQLEPDPHVHARPQGLEVVEGDDTGVTLIFAHLGDGDFPGQEEPLQTGYSIVNNTRQPATGTIHFFDDEGDPLVMQIGDVTDSSFPIRLNPGTVQRLTTSGAGPLKSGWARIHSDQPLVVTSNFGAIRDDGTVITDVGVGQSELGTTFTIFADTIGNNDTGVALTNPSDDQSLQIAMTLRDAAGNLIDEETLLLPPRGHLARFLAQLFPEVPAINEFVGSVELESTSAAAASLETAQEGKPAGVAMLEFAGLTLRISGTVFTSVPLVPPIQAGATFTKLAFPQAADGEQGGLRVTTAPVLFNTSDQAVSGVIEFFKGDGTPNSVGLEGSPTTSVPFEIQPRGVFRIETDGVGAIAVGWAQVSADKPLAGVAIFTIRNGDGKIVAAVGVDSAPLRQNFQLLADTQGLVNTALAIVNPLAEEMMQGEEDPTRINLTLKDDSGFIWGRSEIELGPRQHQAKFLSELFPEIEGIDEFQGRVEASVSSSQDYVVALTLRSAVEKLTSVPVFTQQHAFAPELLFQFAQDLKGTSPAVRLMLHQNDSDLALESLQIDVEGVELLADNFESGQQFGIGFLTNPASVVALIAKDVTAPAGGGASIAFDLLLEDDLEFNRQAVGTLQSLASGDLRLNLQYLGKVPNRFVGDDSDFIVFLDEDLLRSPLAAETTSHVEFLSVSRSSFREQRILRRTEQTLSLADPEPSLSNLESVSSTQLKAGDAIALQGTNFGDDPLVLFPGQSGPIRLFANLSDGMWRAAVPEGVVDGPIRVDNGQGPGNGYLTKSVYGPELKLEIGAQNETETLSLRFHQQQNLFEMQQFEALLLIEDSDFGSVAVDQDMGSFPTGYRLFVKTIEPNRLVLEIASEPGVSVTGQLVLEDIQEDGNRHLQILHQPDFVQETIAILRGPSTFEVVFVGLPVTLPPPGAAVFANARTTSGVTGSDGVDSVLTSFTSHTFLREESP